MNYVGKNNVIKQLGKLRPWYFYRISELIPDTVQFTVKIEKNYNKNNKINTIFHPNVYNLIDVLKKCV